MKDKTMKKVRKTYHRFRNSKAGHILYDKGVLYFVLAFLIPFAVMINGFRKQEIHPFGDQQMLVIDLWHQYYPFFLVVREKLMSGGSFLYSWSNGMGTNFLSLISYYAASPLNWISVFFSDDNTRDALTFILAAKIGFAGAFFSCFLRYTYKRRDFSIVIFSSMFALCSYMLGYYWNVMWFDTVALFPLVMLGITALCREGKWKLYTLALALSLISNYYIAFFTCIFSVFMFIAAIVNEGKGIKDFFRKFGLITASSAAGLGLAGFMLLPAYYGLKMTYSVNNHFPTEWKFYDKWQDIFANLISYDEPSTKEGLPNFACGMLAVVMIGVFLFSAGIKIREKIASVLLLALITVSCNLNMLNYIWHGFHATNQIPHRFAFIFSFILVASAYRAYDVMTRNGIKIYQLILLLAGPAFVLGLNVWTASQTDGGFKFEGAFKSSAVIAGAYVLIFVAGKLFPFKNKLVRRSVINCALAAAVISELVSNAVVGVKTVGSSGYSVYPTAYENVDLLLDDMHDDDKSLFSRAEMTTTYTLNDSALYGYHGVSQFSSSANVSVTRLFRRLGLYASEAGNRYYYRNSTPVVNDLLGINYIMAKYTALNNSSLMALEEVSNHNGAYLYRNKYPMSIGFMMSKNILKLADAESTNPFEYQNELLRLATDIDINVFTAQPVKLVSYDNVEVDKNGFGSYSYDVSDPQNEVRKASYDYDGVAGSYLFGYAANGGIETINVTCNGLAADSNINVKDYPIIFPMGNGEDGSVSTAELTFKKDQSSGNYKLMIYALSREAFELEYEALADEQLRLTEFSDTRVKGTVDAKKNGILYLSIPYEKGWTMYVDGQKTETIPVLNSMLGAELTAGTHEIELRYSPEGFGTGLIISGSAALLFLLMLLAERSVRKKRRLAAQKQQQETHETIVPEMQDDAPDAEVTNEKPESNDSLPRD